MSTMIKDGSGKGYLTRVDEENTLRTTTNVVSRLAHVSNATYRSFSIYGRRDFTAANTDEGILYFEYTGDYDFHIDRFWVASNGNNTKIEMFLNSTYTSGGSAVTPVNLNSGSLRTLESTVYDGSTDLNVTSGSKEIIDLRLGISTLEVNLEGGLLIQKNSNIYFLGEVASPGDEVRVSLLGYEDIIGK